jgi:hypothetical protein
VGKLSFQNSLKVSVNKKEKKPISLEIQFKENKID